jgi:8-oxo-dGTP pyrophosphatase MutT (NUDIX family)
VRPRLTDLQLLMIRRAWFDGDPWSGHVALPGGRRDPADRDGLHTAIRETAEEVGIDLAAGGVLLGALDEVKPTGGAPPIQVGPYVFAVPAVTEPTPNHEVDTAFWIPLRHLADPASAVEHLHALETGEHLTFPAIGYQEFVVWGLTYRILAEFAEVIRPDDGAG